MANATGLPDTPGGHGPKADLADLNKVLVPQEDGGVLSRTRLCGLYDGESGRGCSPSSLQKDHVW